MSDDEQKLAAIRDSIPRLWWSIYQGTLAAGFNHLEAFALLQTWILSQTPNGIQPPRQSGPDTDDPKKE
jgi:hypothetical protein